MLFSESSNVNDIYERHKIHSFVDGLLPTSNGEEYFEALKNVSKIFTKILKKYKQISFTIGSKKSPGNANAMMWGLYAHNTNGVCIEIDSEKLPKDKDIFHSKVKYTDKMPNIDIGEEGQFIDEKYLERFVAKNLKSLFYTKHINWKEEHEYRLISSMQKSLDISNAVMRVVTYNANSIETKIIESIINNEVPISVLRFAFFDNGRKLSTCDLAEYRIFY